MSYGLWFEIQSRKKKDETVEMVGSLDWLNA
jgi:hypothetical protein